MTTFDDRQTAFENKFAHDAELQFKVTARRDKLTGLWAAGLLGHSGDAAETYARSVVVADMAHPGDADIIAKLLADLVGTGTDEAAIRAQLALNDAEARRQLMDAIQMPMAAADIEAAIVAALPGARVDMTDLAGDGDHYAAVVTAAQFAGLPRVKQHQLVYNALGGRMGGVLHALKLTTIPA